MEYDLISSTENKEDKVLINNYDTCYLAAAYNGHQEMIEVFLSLTTLEEKLINNGYFHVLDWLTKNVKYLSSETINRLKK